MSTVSEIPRRRSLAVIPDRVRSRDSVDRAQLHLVSVEIKVEHLGHQHSDIPIRELAGFVWAIATDQPLAAS
jgi:hypothetical protein